MKLTRRTAVSVSIIYFCAFLVFNIFVTPLDIRGDFNKNAHVYTAINIVPRIMMGAVHCVMPFYVARVHLIYLIN